MAASRRCCGLFPQPDHGAIRAVQDDNREGAGLPLGDRARRPGLAARAVESGQRASPTAQGGSAMAVEVTREGAVAVVTVDRPEALNALNTRDQRAAARAPCAALSADEAVRAVVLTGAGETSFVAGADIAEMQRMTAEQARRFGALGQAVMSAIEAAPQPWIAAVNGFALGGGCELALACDIRLAGENAKFGQPEINLGITPGFGGTQRLPRTVGERLGQVPRALRPPHPRRRGPAHRARPGRVRQGRPHGAGDEARRGAGRQEPAGDALLQGGGARRRRAPTSRRGRASSATCSRWRSPRTTSRRAWPRSWRSGRPSSTGR